MFQDIEFLPSMQKTLIWSLALSLHSQKGKEERKERKGGREVEDGEREEGKDKRKRKERQGYIHIHIYCLACTKPWV